MGDPGRRSHWENVYREKGEFQVSWFQDSAATSLGLLDAIGATTASELIDIGGGASRFVDALLDRNYRAVTVLDISEEALALAKKRLGERAAAVRWLAADITQWRPAEQYDIWHDRAAFHFLTDDADRTAYVARLTQALRPGGHAIIGTFALDGPERCSGLPIVRYDPARLSAALGDSFVLVDSRRQDHTTPWGATQRFQFSAFQHK